MCNNAEVVLFISGCYNQPIFQERITDEWLEEHAERVSDNEWSISNTDNPCIVFPNNNKIITQETMEKCCDDEGNCRFESPQYELIIN